MGDHLLLLCLTILYTSISVICEETQLVFGTEGGNVTLQLTRHDVEDVSWIYDGDVRIKTEPGKPITYRESSHKKNMLATEDGSLVITNLSQEDEKVYSASLQLKGDQDSYTIHYDLKVYKTLSAEDIQLMHNVTNAEPCSVFITCMVKKPNATVTWTNGSALSGIGGILYIADAQSSLNITCIAQNPVSNVTKTVKPSEFCKGRKAGGERSRGYPALLALVLLLPLCIFIGGLTWKVTQGRRNRSSPPQSESINRTAVQNGLRVQNLQADNQKDKIVETRVDLQLDC